MTLLARYTLWFSGCMLLLALPLVIAPEQGARLYRSVPRRLWLGRGLSALALAWGGWLLYRMPFEFLQPYRGLIPWMVPVVIVLSWICMRELLAARAIGGLCALLPTPLLTAVRAHASDWRIVVSLTAYALAIKGMCLLMSPYLLRDALDLTLKTPARARTSGLVAAGFGLGLGVLGWLVY